jgi:ParB family chromosome partitioning protein
VAGEAELPLSARLGAIEGLGRTASEQAETLLAEIGANQDHDEELRKAAWRARRRSQRLRARGGV